MHRDYLLERGAAAGGREGPGHVQRRRALDQMVSLARALGVTVDELLADDDAATR